MRNANVSRLLASTVLGIALTVASLLITRHYTQTVTIGNPLGQCATCGSYQVNVTARGWPAAAYTSLNYSGSAAYTGLIYDNAGTHGWQPRGFGTDLVFWGLLAGLGIFYGPRVAKHYRATAD